MKDFENYRVGRVDYLAVTVVLLAIPIAGMIFNILNLLHYEPIEVVDISPGLEFPVWEFQQEATNFSPYHIAIGIIYIVAMAACMTILIVVARRNAVPGLWKKMLSASVIVFIASSSVVVATLVESNNRNDREKTEIAQSFQMWTKDRYDLDLSIDQAKDMIPSTEGLRYDNPGFKSFTVNGEKIYVNLHDGCVWLSGSDRKELPTTSQTDDEILYEN